MSERRFAVVGGGSIGRRHLSNLVESGIRNIVVVDVSDQRRADIEKEFRVPAFANLHEALARGVEVVLICTPSSLHLRQSLQAARAGCHLFIEKPVATSLDGVDALLEEISRKQLVTLVGCNFRFAPGLRMAKGILDDGTIGRILSVRAQFGQYLPEWHPWEDYRRGYSARTDLGGGVIFDRIHEIDYVRWLSGDIKAVAAVAGHLSDLEIETEDTAEILLQFESGAVGSIHVDYSRRQYRCDVEIIGSEGLIQWRHRPQSVRWYRAVEKKWNSCEWPQYEDNAMYVEEIEHFLRVLEGAEESTLDAEDGARVLGVALAAKQAASESRMVTIQ